MTSIIRYDTVVFVLRPNDKHRIRVIGRYHSSEGRMADLTSQGKSEMTNNVAEKT